MSGRDKGRIETMKNVSINVVLNKKAAYQPKGNEALSLFAKND